MTTFERARIHASIDLLLDPSVDMIARIASYLAADATQKQTKGRRLVPR